VKSESRTKKTPNKRGLICLEKAVPLQNMRVDRGVGV
jgi:hypothetical protein